MTDFYVNFISDLSPGGEFLILLTTYISLIVVPVGVWSAFEANSRQVINLQRDNVTLVPDGMWFDQVLNTLHDEC